MEPAQPTQYDTDAIAPVLIPGDVGYQVVGQHFDGGYQTPSHSPAEQGTDAAQCPSCHQERTLLPYASGLGNAECVVCNVACQVGTDYVFMECGHAIHLACLP